ncbi:DUT1 (YBR252W) [Zygosaccharomyces parabailii]|uniref:Deoxyuridine 5'-triphosphate nucleotidohydrolase n=1 Tax=Zygosaccharomyces bailii (strain CLIB 213 / ATCC 58445 / CBS 680 / BCRC 21525 / NBRC 1098 / NCYC 1416 / NRRL Y-2227) TaxID=1333698 RepID=A0A8J2T4J2_ZYGB2|nr:DUT1 (YBR252W) [Zygosaccharomyces parabailii]CDF88125.1 BN860_02894g1_1 [Zygosaccharomyces bailii CLIB 213]CDH09045.1 probable Deoxyuridine 5'-triphosphate nucleotidohydrolase [Zygosaccharomyces bailii ISA1307]SJM87435.1 probable Deoxyuridine 5'-triphosphate nucleotidohydrolase [Zygosaccharomyces bailii]
MSNLVVQLRSSSAKTPTKGSLAAAGYDIYASQPTVIPARGQGLVPTDVSFTVPEGTYGRIAPRSGLAVKHGIQTGAGVVDRDYTGEVKVVLFNHSDRDFQVNQGDRVAQLILERIVDDAKVVVVESLEETARGHGGFGSTGH